MHHYRAYVDKVGMIYPDIFESYHAGMAEFHTIMEGYRLKGRECIMMRGTKFYAGHDDNAEEIFDGDILKITFSEGERTRPAIFTVMFCTAFHTYKVVDAISGEELMLYELRQGLPASEIESVEIMGNQYENRNILVDARTSA